MVNGSVDRIFLKIYPCVRMQRVHVQTCVQCVVSCSVGSPCQMGEYTFAVKVSNGYADVFCGFNASVVECVNGTCPQKSQCVSDDNEFNGLFGCECANNRQKSVAHTLVNATCEDTTALARNAQVEAIKEATTQTCFAGGDGGGASLGDWDIAGIAIGVVALIALFAGTVWYAAKRAQDVAETRLRRTLRQSHEQLRRDLHLGPVPTFGEDALPDDIGIYIYVTRETRVRAHDDMQRDFTEQVKVFLSTLPCWKWVNTEVRSVRMLQSRERILVVITKKRSWSRRRRRAKLDGKYIALEVNQSLSSRPGVVYFTRKDTGNLCPSLLIVSVT